MTTHINQAIFTSRYESNQSLKNEHGTFQEDVKANGIDFTHVIALKSITSLREFTAKDSQLGSIEAKYNVNLTDCSAQKVTTESGRVTWKNQNQPLGPVSSIEASDHVEVVNVDCESIKSSTNSITLKGIEVHSVTSKYNANLTDCRAKSVNAENGDIVWKNQMKTKDPAQEIKAKKNIDLHNVRCSGVIESSAGSVTIAQVTANKIQSKYSINLTNSRAVTVDAESGRVTWKNDKKHKKAAHSIKASDTIELTNISCSEEVQSTTSSVTITNTKAKKVSAKYGLTIKESQVSSAESELGDVNWENTDFPKKPAKQIKAAKSMKLVHVHCSGNIASATGSIIASEISAHTINAKYTIHLLNSQAAVVESESGKIQWENQNKPESKAESIKAHDSVTLSNVDCLGNIESLTDSVHPTDVTARNILSKYTINGNDVLCESANSQNGSVSFHTSTVKSIVAFKDVVLDNTNTDKVVSSTGSVKIINSNPLSIVSVRAKWAIELAKVNVSEEVVSESGSIQVKDSTFTLLNAQNGNVTADRSTIRSIQANDQVTLTNTIVQDIVSTNGSINVSHLEYHVVNLKSVKAKYSIQLCKVDVSGDLSSESGSITVQEGVVKTVQAFKDITLENSLAEAVISTKGSIKIKNKGVELIELKHIQAEYGIELERVKYSKKITSVSGSVSASFSELQEIESNRSLRLQSCKCKSIYLRVFEKAKIEIDLKDSIIEGDFIIDVQLPQNYVESVTNTIVENRFSILSNREFSNLNFSFKGLKDGRNGTINDIPYKYENGKFHLMGKIPVKEVKTPKELIVQIKGGTIAGAIKFINGDGRYELLENASVKSVL